MRSKEIDVHVPDIGDAENVLVAEIMVQPGVQVTAEQSVLVLETDKATLEIPAGIAGIIQRFTVNEGDRVNQGDKFCTMLLDVESAKADAVPTPIAAQPDLPATPSQEAPTIANSVVSSPQPGQNANAIPPKAGPAVRKLARLLGVNLEQITGRGKAGRILKEDVESFVRNRMAVAPEKSEQRSGIPVIPEVDFARFGEIDVKPLQRIQKISSTHLHRAWLNVPHVTQFESADITNLEAFRKAAGEGQELKLTLLPFLIKAVTQALAQFLRFNASLAADGENLILKKYMHIGFAADTDAGLVVPVVKNADRKGVRELAQECGALASKAREGKLTPDDMKGGCFTISSLGGIGIRGTFTPIVNAPEVAILGVSRATMQPVWNGREFVPRLVLPLSLSYDHRVIDGALGSRFLLHLVKLLENMQLLLL